MIFDPDEYLKGGTVGAPPQAPGSSGRFDVDAYLAGKSPAEQSVPQAPQPVPSGAKRVEMAPGVAAHPNSPNWPKIFGGPLKEIQTRVTPSQGEYLDQLRGDDEAIAGAVTKSWAHDAYPQMNPNDIDQNWDVVRPQIAKNAFGVDDPHMDNRTFYGLVQKHFNDEVNFRATLPEALANVPTAVAKNMVDWFHKPAVELPEAPKDTPDIPGLGFNNPALWAGVYNGAVRPFVNFSVSPEGMTFLAGGSELKALSEVYPVAKAVLGGISGLFGYMMGSQYIKDAPEVVNVVSDPKSTLQQKVEVISKEMSNAMMTLAGTFGMVEELGVAKDMENYLKGKTPAEAAEETRVQALLAKDPKEAEALAHAGETLEMVTGIKSNPGVPTPPGSPSLSALPYFEEGGPVMRAPGSEHLQPPHSEPIPLEQIEFNLSDELPKPIQIAAAAIKLEDGTVVEGPNHPKIREQVPEGNAPASTDGFVTDKGDFVDRVEGQAIAEEAGQVPVSYDPTKELHSEDLPLAKELPIAKPEPGETTTPQRETSLKNAVAEMERKGYRMEEATPTERREMAKSWLRSAEAISRDSGRPARLVKELIENPERGLSDDESAMILRHKVSLTNALDQAIDIAYDENQTPELREEARKQSKAISRELNDLMDAVHKRGSAWGREGRWRQAMAKDDYSFEAQQRRSVAAKGRELTEDEIVKLKKDLDAIKAKNAELEAHMDALRAQRSPEQAADKAIRELAKPPSKPRAQTVASRLRDSLHDRALKARQELAGKVLTPGPKDIYNMSVITADWVVANGIDFAKWSADAAKEFGEKIKPVLQDVWQAGLKLYHTELRGALIADFQAKGSVDVVPDVSPLAQELARTFISQGTQDRDLMVDLVHEQLKQVQPDITRDDASDAIAGYGKYRPLTHDEITDQLREWKGELLEMAKIRDLEAGEIVKKSGQEFAKPSEERKALQKKVAGAQAAEKVTPAPAMEFEKGVEQPPKESFSIPAPMDFGKTMEEIREKQAKTARDSIERGYKKKIELLEKEIATRERVIKSAGVKVEYDEGLRKLKARVEELTAERNEVFKAETDRAIANRWNAIRAGKIYELEEKLRNEDYSKTPRKQPPALDKRGMQIQGQLKEMQNALAVAREIDKEKRQPGWQRKARVVAEGVREATISGYHIFGKIIGFSQWAQADAVLLQGMAEIMKKTPGFGKLEKGANMEMGGNFSKNIGTFFKEYYTTGMKDALQTMKTGRNPLKMQLGDPVQNARPLHWWNISGISHIVEKSPLFRATYEQAMSAIEQHAAKYPGSVDMSDGLTQAAMQEMAINRANYAILQEDRGFTDWINDGFRKLERENPETGEADKGKVALATLLRVFVTKGIIKTPYNYFAQTMERSPVALAFNLNKLREFNKDTTPLKDMDPKQVNAIAHLIKVGMVGTGMFVWGALDALRDPKDRIFGGYYQPGTKRDPNDVGYGTLRIDGHSLWHPFAHHPLIEEAQMGNTMVRVALSHIKGGADKGWIAGVMASIFTPALQAPIVNPINRIGKDVYEGHPDQAVYDEVAGLIPGIVDNVARDMDKAKARKEKGPVDTFRARIPILREQVPERDTKKGELRDAMSPYQ